MYILLTFLEGIISTICSLELLVVEKSDRRMSGSRRESTFREEVRYGRSGELVLAYQQTPEVPRGVIEITCRLSTQEPDSELYVDFQIVDSDEKTVRVVTCRTSGAMRDELPKPELWGPIMSGSQATITVGELRRLLSSLLTFIARP